jgi:hypothetical protein
MQTVPFSEALSNAVRQIRLEDIVGMLKPMFAPSMQKKNPRETPEGKRFVPTFLDAFAEHRRLEKREEEIIDLLGFADVFKADRVEQLTTAWNSFNSWGNVASDRRFVELYYMASAGLRLSETVRKLLVEPKLEGVSSDSGILIFELDDYGAHGVAPSRLAMVLTEIDSLYRLLASVASDEATEPLVIYIDTGSWFSIAVKGGAKFVKSLGDVFARCVNGARFWSNDRIERDHQTTKVIMESLLDLKVLKDANAIDPERAEEISNAMAESILKLHRNGVSTPQVAVVRQVSATAVLLESGEEEEEQEQRLLGPGTDDSVEKP